MKLRTGEPYSVRHKKQTQNPPSPKLVVKERILTEAETRRDAAKAYGLLASQRNRKVVERRTKKDTMHAKSPTLREKCTSPKVRLKRSNLDDTRDLDELSDSTSRVQAWLCETPMMSMRRGLLDDDFRVVDAKKSSDSPLNLTVDKTTQTELSAFRAQPILAVDVECQTTFSEHSLAFGDSSGVRDHSKTPHGYDLTSSCSIGEIERDSAMKQEEYEVLARIQELKERRDSLIAEKRVILMKIEELKLRQEVRTLERDVSKAHDELRSLVSKEEKEEMQIPRTPQVPTEELVNAQQQRSMILSSGEVEIRDTPNELMETDGGASHALSKSDTDTTDEREGCVSETSNNIPSCTIEVVNQAGDSHGHSFDAMTDKSFQKETVFDGPDYDLQEIKDYFSRSADLRSAPAVLFGSTQEKETESFIKASSYDGVEMLSVCELESEDVQSRAFADVLDGDQDDHKDKETFSESEVMTVSLDDEDEYTTMLDSIPLNTTTPTPEANQQGDEEDTADLFLEAQFLETRDQVEQESHEIHLPIAPVFPEPPAEQEMSAIDTSASSVFCSPRNGRSSPRSPVRQMLDPELLRNQQSPEMDVPTSDPSQPHRLPSPISESLITASSCSSCWVQFSQTDKAFVQGLIAKFLRTFCNPHPPRYLSSNELPISLHTFTAIERETANSQVQEAFDRAIFDTVNQRLIEIYQCLGRLKVDDSELDESQAWQVPTYEGLLESVQKTVFSTTDCDADPLAAYSSKEHIIEQMLKQDAHHLQKHTLNITPRFLSPPRNH